MKIDTRILNLVSNLETRHNNLKSQIYELEIKIEKLKKAEESIRIKKEALRDAAIIKEEESEE